jgi:predicted membrane protein
MIKNIKYIFLLRKYGWLLLLLNFLIFWSSFFMMPWYVTVMYFIIFFIFMLNSPDIVGKEDFKKYEIVLIRRKKLKKINKNECSG